MKITVLTLGLILGIQTLLAQNLPINRNTGLVSIRDSISLNQFSVKEFKQIVSKWGNNLRQKANIETLFLLTKDEEVILSNFYTRFFHISDETGKDVYTNSGKLTYFGYNRDPIFKERTSADATNGEVSFNLVYSIKSNQFIFEFTNFEFNGSGSGGKFENEKPEKPFTVGVLAQNKKRWQKIKTDYTAKFKLLSNNLKDFVSTYMAQSKTETTSADTLSYEKYQNIKTGMSYTDVVKLLGSEGKELNNISSQVGGKSVTQQIIVWQDLDKSKTITLTFSDEVVISKSQANL